MRIGRVSMVSLDWKWKIGEAIERIESRYSHIGSKTAAPFLSIIIDQENEINAIKEFKVQASRIEKLFSFHYINILEVTETVVEEIGATNVVEAINDPMPGDEPIRDLGELWLKAIIDVIKERIIDNVNKPVIVLEQLSALYPVIGPRDIMHRLWNSQDLNLRCPVVFLIPGTIKPQRTYSFLDKQDEFMYRGDLI